MTNNRDHDSSGKTYRLDDQVGFLLRRASQRHLAIFSHIIKDLTPTQFAVLAKLGETGPVSQNALGRMTAMDAATIKGVVDRLIARGLLETRRDPHDKRRSIVSPSATAQRLYTRAEPLAATISAQTLAPLTPDEQAVFLEYLRRLS